MKVRPNLLAGEDLAPEPRQKRSRDKRARLKAAGLLLFGEKGYESTSVDDIARRAKLAVGSFYQHFRTKRQLLLALMDELLEKLSQLDFRPRTVSDVRAVVHELLSRAFSNDLRYLGAYRAWQEAVLSDPELARKQVKIHAWTTGRVMPRCSSFCNNCPVRGWGRCSRIGAGDGQLLLELARAGRAHA